MKACAKSGVAMITPSMSYRQAFAEILVHADFCGLTAVRFPYQAFFPSRLRMAMHGQYPSLTATMRDPRSTPGRWRHACR